MKYRAKTVEVEAVQHSGDYNAIVALIGDIPVEMHIEVQSATVRIGPDGDYGICLNLDDWLIKRDGELSVSRREAFAETYELGETRP